MKMGRTMTLVAMTAVGVASAAQGFGPADCVSVSRSTTGSCVVKTNCGGQDLSNFDLSFDCVAQSGRQTHSMGVGSFDNEEEYDTDLKCQQCLPPAAKPTEKKALAKKPKVAAKGVSLAAIAASREVKLRGTGPAKRTARKKARKEKEEEEKKRKEEKKEENKEEKEEKNDDKEEKEEKEDAPKAEWYGPEECVGVWKDEKTGSCVMQTDCDTDTQLNVYEFGMICVDKSDEMTRHIFGMGSFGHKETFDTLIKCEQCLALDEYMDGGKAIGQLTKMVKGMKEDLSGVTGQVSKLNQEVFPKVAGPAGAPAPAAASSAPAAAQPSQFLRVAAPPQEPPAAAPVAPKKDTPVVMDAVANQEVTHVKKKHSVEAQQSVTDILAAAVKGAAARGDDVKGVAKAVMGTAAAQQAPPAPIAATQTQQQVTQDVAKEAAADLKKVEVVEEEEDEKDEDEEDDHSKAEEEDD